MPFPLYSYLLVSTRPPNATLHRTVRWLDWSRKSEKFVAVWTMSPPELDEAMECARLWGIPREIAASTYNTFGPSLRLIRRVTTPQRYNQELKSLTDSVNKIVNTSLGTVERILKNSDHNASAADLRLAQQIFLITPAEERHSELLRIMNPFISDLVIKKLDTLEDQSRET
ncbi:hypothetical protein ONZ45_g7972 [Pleurotus djamor]|nr:hypothetical protein ONZ45_g7972 [Pleurotus djamor]